MGGASKRTEASEAGCARLDVPAGLAPLKFSKGDFMRQSISTKYIGATEFRVSRVRARSSSGLSVTLPWDDALGTDENHTAAAQALAVKLGWNGHWVAGAAPDGRGNVYVQDDGDGFAVEVQRTMAGSGRV